MKNKYTVIIVTFEGVSFFTLHVYADNLNEAIDKALYFGQGETGLLYDEVLDVFEGFVESIHPENNPINIVE